MGDINTTIFTGRLVTEPELKTTLSGKFVTTFNIACERGFGEKKKVLYPTLVAWNGQAEFAAKLPKSTKIAVRCEMDGRTWESKNKVTNVVEKHRSIEFIVQEIFAMEAKRAAGTAATADGKLPSYSQSENNFEDLSSDDELPF